MNPEEYAAQQALITAAAANYALQFGGFLIRPGMGTREWLQLLRVLYPEIEQRRYESADLARTFYDTQRSLYLPDLPRNDRPLEGTSFETFVKSMDPVRKTVIESSRVDPVKNLDVSATPATQVTQLLRNPRQQNAAVTRLALQTMREVENAGRRQIIHAVQEDQELEALLARLEEGNLNQRQLDPEPTVLDYKGQPVRETSSLIRGWARVATGRETCAWCLMLISRGPVYLGANTAGLNLDDRDAIDMIAAGEDVSDLMEDWHTGCDCKVVPVFKVSEWVGRDAWKRAEELWNEADKEARALRRDSEDPLVYKLGKNKGATRSLNDEVINALRRRLNSGEINMSEFAAFAA